MNFKGKKITLHDMCLRDGMHPKRHQISVEQMIDIACALDDAGGRLLGLLLGGPQPLHPLPHPLPHIARRQ